MPAFVLEYLLGANCPAGDEGLIAEGLETVKRILADNYVRSDEQEKVKSLVRERGSYKIIDKVSVALNAKRDVYEATLVNLNIKGADVAAQFVKKFDKLLVGGIWCVVTLRYFHEENQKSLPYIVEDLKPIQMPNLDMEELFTLRGEFTEEQWIDVLLRSAGYEPTQFEPRVKWHLLCRLIPLVENNFNVCELGPKSIGKSSIYKDVSPYTILMSGGQTSVANLFVNLANGSLARGRDSIAATASMVFVGNFKEGTPVEGLIKSSHLLAPFPPEMIDSAFFDRFHASIPGWEIPKMRPDFLPTATA